MLNIFTSQRTGMRLWRGGWLLLAILSGVAFYFISLAVKQEILTNINLAVTVKLQDNIPDRLGTLLDELTLVVSPLASSIYIIVITLIYGISIRRKQLQITSLAIPIMFFLLVVAEVIGKQRVESPAPPFFLLKNPTAIFPTYHIHELYSYPSGHTARALFIAILGLYRFFPSATSLVNVSLYMFGASIIGLLVTLISVGKVYLGHHWFSDVLGGAILAIACVAVCIAVLPLPYRRASNNRV